MKWTSVIIIHSIPPRKACSPQNNQTRQPAKSTVIWLQLTIAWPSTRNLPHPASLRLNHFLAHSPHFVVLLNYFSFSTLLLGCCLSGRGVLLFSFWLCVFSRDISLKWHKMVVLLFWMTDFLWHTWHTCQHSLVRYKWTLEGFERVKISRRQGRTPQTQVLFVPWDVWELKGKWNNLICSLPISIFLFLFLLYQNEKQLFISS